MTLNLDLSQPYQYEVTNRERIGKVISPITFSTFYKHIHKSNLWCKVREGTSYSYLVLFVSHIGIQNMKRHRYLAYPEKRYILIYRLAINGQSAYFLAKFESRQVWTLTAIVCDSMSHIHFSLCPSKKSFCLANSPQLLSSKMVPNVKSEIFIQRDVVFM